MAKEAIDIGAWDTTLVMTGLDLVGLNSHYLIYTACIKIHLHSLPITRI